MMIPLEKRFYSRQEIGEAVGVSPQSSQFARDVKTRLTNAGYTFNWINRRGVEITGWDDSPEMRLKRLLIERVGLNTQIDAVFFARFIIAFSCIDGFSAMPWETRAKVLTEYTGKEISESTLRRWASKLYETDNAFQNERAALWHTYTDAGGIKHQERADKESEEYKIYCDARHEIMDTLEKSDIANGNEKNGKRTRYGRMIKILYNKYGVYYYCSAFVLNALGEAVDEMLALIDEIREEKCI